MTSPVRIPADVDMPDRVVGPLTARQAVILGTTGLVLYSVWDATRSFLAPAASLAPSVISRRAKATASLMSNERPGLGPVPA